ncbi:MAG: helix-turn-helix transcriptional regulator [Clostridia bacterium]|nr:helix-turn-helix transcriptional regulator [Clostridia bacterium]
MTLVEQIKKRLSEAIEQSGISQTIIAEKIGVCQQAVSSYAKRQKMPSIETLSRLCRVLDADANDILCLEIDETGK